MKDRVATKPNRYAVYDDSHNFLRYEYHERADEPTEAGTPLNKATFLKDTTAEAYGLNPATATPDQAFVKLADSRFKIGDIKISSRSDLGSNWLLCNGAEVNTSTYPELASVLPGAPTKTWTATSLPANLQAVAYGNGYWVAAGYQTPNKIFVKSGKPEGTWTEITQGPQWIMDIVYGGGYWVAAGQSGTALLYKTGADMSLSPTSTWSVNSQFNSIDVNALAYGNGYWVAIGVNGVLYYTTNPSTTWTSNGTLSTEIFHVAYGNGYWVATGSGGKLYYKSGNPSGTWTQNNQGAQQFYCVTYGNGYWVAVGLNGTLYYKAGNPAGAWTANNQGSQNLRSVTYADGYWVAVGANGTLYYKAGNPAGAWTANNQGNKTLYSVAQGNGYWTAVGDDSTVFYTGLTLPALTANGAYYYIKAKED